MSIQEVLQEIKKLADSKEFINYSYIGDVDDMINQQGFTYPGLSIDEVSIDNESKIYQVVLYLITDDESLKTKTYNVLKNLIFEIDEKRLLLDAIVKLSTTDYISEGYIGSYSVLGMQLFEKGEVPVEPGYVRSVNGQTGDVILFIPEKVSDLEQDIDYITESDVEDKIDGKLAPIENDIQNIEGQISDINNDILDINDKVDSLVTGVSSVNGQTGDVILEIPTDDFYSKEEIDSKFNDVNSRFLEYNIQQHGPITENKGVISDFSEMGFFAIPHGIDIDFYKECIFKFGIQTGNDIEIKQYLVYCRRGLSIYIENSKLVIDLLDMSPMGLSKYVYISDYELLTNEKYSIELYHTTDNKFKLNHIDKDGNIYYDINVDIPEDIMTFPRLIFMGGGMMVEENYFRGSIDLNNSYFSNDNQEIIWTGLKSINLIEVKNKAEEAYNKADNNITYMSYLATRMSSAEDNISEIQFQLTGIQTNINGLSLRTSLIEWNANYAKNKSEEVENRVNSLVTGVSSVNGQTGDVTIEVPTGDFYTKTEIDDKVDNINNEISNIYSSVDDIKNNDIYNINNDIYNINNDIYNLDLRVGQNEADISLLRSDVDGIVSLNYLTLSMAHEIYVDKATFGSAFGGLYTNVNNLQQNDLVQDSNISKNRNDINTLQNQVSDLQLFKFPNVTIIGEPTINNGQISDFSNDNYLEFPFLVDFHGRAFEINFEIRTGDNVISQENILDSNFGLAFAIRNRVFVLALSTTGTNWNLGEVIGNSEVTPNTSYLIKLSYDKLTYKIEFSVNRGATYITDATKVAANQSPYPRQIFIGRSYVSNGNHFSGIINFNNCNLLINNELVWLGMDDVGLATRLATDLSNIDEAGIQKIKDIAGSGPEGDYVTRDEFNDLDTRVSDDIVNLQNDVYQAKTDIEWLQNDSQSVWEEVNKKQDQLESGVNIKTINGQDILGEGNITIQGGGGSGDSHLSVTFLEWFDLPESEKMSDTVYLISDAEQLQLTNVIFSFDSATKTLTITPQ